MFDVNLIIPRWSKYLWSWIVLYDQFLFLIIAWILSICQISSQLIGNIPQVVAQDPVGDVGYNPAADKNDSEVQSRAFPIWPDVPV